MLEIMVLSELEMETLNQIMTGYVSAEKYIIKRTQSAQNTVFSIELVTLEKPYIKPYSHLDSETFADYQQTLQAGFSLGAYVDNVLVGIAIVVPERWNNSLRVQEFHVAESQRGKGIGRALMAALIEKSRAAHFRVIVCETQNANVPAIRFYRRMGFTLDGIDLSFYSNDDYPDGEIAVFMKRKLTMPLPQ